MGQTVVEKIARRHLAQAADRPLRPGDYVSIRPRQVMTHDNTAPVMKKFRDLALERVHDPRQPVFVLDHDIQNRSPANLARYRAIEAFALEQGIDFFPAGSGIGHQVLVEQQYVVPGAFVVASDSHANMYGGIGALGTPVVRTDAAAIWARGTFWWRIPRTVQVVLEGRLPAGVAGKDAILALCGLYDRGEVRNAAVEFTGPGIATLGVEERLTIANMTTEWGALAGWFPVDRHTIDYLERRRAILADRGIRRIDAADLQRWSRAPVAPDRDASYAGQIVLDLSELSPHVCGPDSVHVATPLSEIEPRRIRIDKAYLVSCVNSREGDIARAAEILAGHTVAAGVEFYLAAASREVQEESERRGDWQTLLDAGARPLPPGCGPCIGLGAGLLRPGEVGISASNRNFKGRMGSPDAQCYLASPAVVAASAVAGFVCAPQAPSGGRLKRHHVERRSSEPVPGPIEILPGLPRRLRGRLVFLPADNMNTDAIYGKDFTYRDDMTPEAMGRVVFANYDPAFAEVALEGDVLLGGWNFGSGSSREQAVTALQARRITAAIAGDFSWTYLRNALNNGFTCIECPALLEHLREVEAVAIAAGARTLVPGDEVEIDFAGASIAYRGTTFRCAPLGAVPQALILAGGAMNQIRNAARR